MIRTTLLACALWAPLYLSLNGATVSIVNQTNSTGPTLTTGGGASSTPASTTASTGTKTSGQQAVGKLPPTSSSNARSSRKPKLEIQESPQHPEEPSYTYPGLLAKVGKRWVGNDYLYNMHRNIGIKVEVVTQEGKDVPVDKSSLAAVVSDIFEKGGISPESLASEETPPLPFFHVLIFAFSSEQSNVAFVSGRLFEDALLARYGLDPIGTWQAISWEKQDLVITSPQQFDEQLRKSVEAIAGTFIDRVEMYAKIKEESESNAKLYYPKVIPAPAKN